MTDVRIEQLGPLDAVRTQAVSDLLDAVADTDGVSPLSEHAMLHLRHGGDPRVISILLYDDEGVAGYAHLDVTDAVLGSSAELAVHPRARCRGYGRQLVQALLDASPDGRMRLWAHGMLPGSEALAARMGFRKARVLWQMRRSLLAPLPAVKLPPGVTVRTFVVGQDEHSWTRVNNRAFADHPDQGAWSSEEVMIREKEPWFDPAGFFLAERDGELVGFHWTKVHGGTQEHDHPHAHAHAGDVRHQHGHDHEALGEVYIVGVDPSAQGLGLGPALTIIGLRHLRALGLTQALLYVDEVNTNAIKVYEALGFARWDTDVSYQRG